MDIDQAELSALDEAIRRQPDSAQLYYQRGTLWFNEGSGDYRRAEADFDTALRLYPAFVDALCARAELYRWQQRNEECIADCDRAIALCPTAARAFSIRAAAKLVRGDAAGAIADFTVVLEFEPDQPGAFIGAALPRRNSAMWRERASILPGPNS
jgi:tetratricopeptide (TPR) repeat protein